MLDRAQAIRDRKGENVFSPLSTFLTDGLLIHVHVEVYTFLYQRNNSSAYEQRLIMYSSESIGFYGGESAPECRQDLTHNSKDKNGKSRIVLRLNNW